MAIAIFEKLLLLTLKSALSEMMLHASTQYRSEISSVIRGFELPMLIGCYFGYFFLCLILTEGHTLGKSIMGLKVHRPHAPFTELTPMEALMRTSGYLICYLSLGTLFLIPILSRSKKGLPDWLSGTVVSSEAELLEIQAQLDHEAKQSEVRVAQLLLFPEDPGAQDPYRQKSA